MITICFQEIEAMVEATNIPGRDRGKRSPGLDGPSKAVKTMMQDERTALHTRKSQE